MLSAPRAAVELMRRSKVGGNVRAPHRIRGAGREQDGSASKLRALGSAQDSAWHGRRGPSPGSPKALVLVTCLSDLLLVVARNADGKNTLSKEYDPGELVSSLK
jgi:hypothetical protein